MRCTVLMSLVAIAGLQIASLSAADGIRVQVRPSIAPAPADVSITVRLQPHPDNRFLVAEAESELAYRSSLEQVDGDRAAATHTFRWRGLPHGQYDIRITLLRAGGERLLARSQIHVISTGAE